MNTEMQGHYQAVLIAERAERERIKGELSRLNQQLKLKEGVIATLTAAIEAEEAASRALAKPLPFATPVGLGTVPANAVFVGISVRWAILCLMSDYAREPMSTSDMAEALGAGGVRSGSVNFNSNVSAVVSDMVKNRKELEPVDTKYQITQQGRDVWKSIKDSRQYRQRRQG